ncbi:MAG: carbohydrate porin [Sulfuricella sp.]|nr:carbohydrate porin [Sulfuricella sp.]
MKPLALAAALLFAAAPACAAPSEAELVKLIQKLNQRLDNLEKRNAELESKVQAAGTTAKAPAELEKRVQSLELAQEQISKGLESDQISQYEPDITARLKAVENDALDMKKAAKKIDALDGLTAGASLTTVAQRPYGLPAGTANNNSQLNYRADITAELPLEPVGDIDHKIFAHFRIGQGLGLNTPFASLGAFASAPNAVAFRASGAPPDDSTAILGQAWYQAAIPLPSGGYKPQSHETLELTFGKMDIFGFFDQNAAAGDESVQFLNSAFVHNPLLDAGGQVGVDANGFQPGFVASYYNYADKPQTWRLSLGVFGTGQGANYQRFFSSPLVMAQAETSLKFDGLTGNYRAYAWHQGQGAELGGTLAAQRGWGVSADQRVGDGVTLFGRYGQMTKGSVPFDRTLTLGAELNGSYWGRGGDAIGLAGGWLRSSSDYRAAGGTLDLLGDDDGTPATAGDNVAFTPDGAERVAEIYYRYSITKQFEISPDFQYISRMGANPGAGSVKVLGLRAQLAY